MHNARAPDESFNRAQITQRLLDLMERQTAKGEKRVWTLGDETAKTIDEIDWDRTVAK